MRMIMLARFIGAAACALAAYAGAVAGVAQERDSDRLSVFEGTWTRKDAVPPMMFHETCAWLQGGRRHMVCRGWVRRATGEEEEHLKVFSYRAADSTFVVYSATGSGPATTYTGRPDGGRWVFNAESRGDDSRRYRIVITPSATAIRFVEESSQSGGPWKVAEDYTFVRVTGGAK